MSSTKIAKVFQVCHSELEEGFYSARLVSRLYSQQCITTEEMEQVDCSGGLATSFDRSRKLIDILRKKPDLVLDSVLAALHEDGTQTHLERILHDAALSLGYYGVASTARTRPGKGNGDQVLPGKWWPQHKELIVSLVNRVGQDGQLLVHQLRKQLESNEGRVTAIVSNKQVIVGMGGIGKTIMAKWYANVYEAEYDHIIWLDSEKSSLKISFKNLGDELELSSDSGWTFDQRVREIFKKLQRASCLFIFDNAERFDGDNGLKNVLPRNKLHHALITSRNQDWGNPNEFGQIATLQLDVFTGPECISLLSSQLGPLGKCGDEEEMLALGKELGFLPLALQCAVATIRKSTRYTISSYLARVKESLEILVGKRILNEYERPISATLRLSIQQIEEDEEMDKDCRKFCNLILKVASYCEPSNIPEFIFLELPNASEDIVSDALDQLVVYSLMSSEQRLTSGFGQERLFGMHRLLQHVVRNTFFTSRKVHVTKSNQSPANDYSWVKLVLECMRPDLSKFSRHAMHAWRTMSMMPELNEVQRSCSNFPYQLSFNLPYGDLLSFMNDAVFGLGRVYNEWELPFLQLKLRLVDILSRNEGMKVKSTIVYDQVLQISRYAQDRNLSPSSRSLELHLQIVGVELRRRLGDKAGDADDDIFSTDTLYTFQNVFKDLVDSGYDGIVEGIKLHYFFEPGTSGLCLRLRFALDYAACLYSHGKVSNAIELLRTELTLQEGSLGIKNVCAIENYISHHNLTSIHRSIMPILYKLLKVNVEWIIAENVGQVTISSTEGPIIGVSVARIGEHYTQYAHESSEYDMDGEVVATLEVLRLLANILQLFEDEPVALTNILDGLMNIIYKIHNPSYGEWSSTNKRTVSRSIAGVLDKIWTHWVGQIHHDGVEVEASDLLLSKVMPLNFTYSHALLAAGRGLEILNLDTETKSILNCHVSGNTWKVILSSLYDNEEMCWVAGNEHIAALIDIDSRLTDGDKKQLLESSTVLMLYIIKSSPQSLFSSFLPGFVVLYDEACYTQLLLGCVAEAVSLWNVFITKLITEPHINLELMSSTGRETLAFLEGRADQKFAEIRQTLMEALAKCVRIMLEREDDIWWNVSQAKFVQLLIRLITCEQYGVAGELMTRCELGKYWPAHIRRIGMPIWKELDSHLWVLTDTHNALQDGDRWKQKVEFILSKLEELQVIYSKGFNAEKNE